jgi:phosphoglycolate phosphatase
MNKLTSIRGVAFDLDGTLIDSAPGLAYAVDSALYALELPQAGEERVITWIGNGADVLMERALAWALTEKSRPQADDELRAMMRRLFDRYYAQAAQEGSFLFPGVVETLSALKQSDIALALVTNKPTAFVMPILTALGISDFFRVIIGGDDVEHKKPHPEAVLKVMQKLHLQPDALLFVGDSRNDILAARAAGCRSVGLTYGYNYGEAIALSKPDYVYDRLQEILPLVGLPHYEHQE